MFHTRVIPTRAASPAPIRAELPPRPGVSPGGEPLVPPIICTGVSSANGGIGPQTFAGAA